MQQTVVCELDYLHLKYWLLEIMKKISNGMSLTKNEYLTLWLILCHTNQFNITNCYEKPVNITFFKATLLLHLA